MKPFSRIIILTSIVIGIICFWLAPGINTAANRSYTRVYEDTERQPALNVTGDTTKSTATVKEEKKQETKKYKLETIRKDAKMKELNASMFSRAIQFSEDAVKVDSTETVAQKDSVTTRKINLP